MKEKMKLNLYKNLLLSSKLKKHQFYLKLN